MRLPSGGIVRAGIDADEDLNTTAVVGFVKTGSWRCQYRWFRRCIVSATPLTETTSLSGIVADTKLQDGALVLQGEYVNRQKNFYDDLAHDAGLSERYRALQERVQQRRRW